ncbi:hypothetical protein [Maribacter arenosus]|uniref:Uncharacterized protein n=1 Tax=Maribacter arenosus TaxID=1854708 RepID=A0ABR7VGA9_9FLAO|nr:hypothetical protein [Maribacter arenosus]MBD0851956.1 hypothetical protein [Maribacter arenosus]
MSNIQMGQAERLKKEFELSGKECNHSFGKLKEYYLGTATGDYRCSNCYEVL